MSLLPTQSSAEAFSPLSSACGWFPPSSLSTEPSSEISASIPGTYFLQIIIYAFHHSFIHYHAGLVVQSARDGKDVTFYHLKMPNASEPKRRDPRPRHMSQYRLIPIPISICASRLSELHHLLTVEIVPFYHSGPEWLSLALNWMEGCGFLSKCMGSRCYSRMCSAIHHYSSRERGVPWNFLRGDVDVDILDGPTQIVALKRPLADGLSW